MTDSEKLNLILSELQELKATVDALQKSLKESKRQDRATLSDEWLDYRDAAEMMRRPSNYFRKKDGLGDYKYWPHIERWQPGGPGSRLSDMQAIFAALESHGLPYLKPRPHGSPVNMIVRRLGVGSIKGANGGYTSP